MKKSNTTSVDCEEILSSLDIQDWNKQAFASEIFDNIGQILSLAKFRIATLDPEKEEEARQIMAQSDEWLAKAIQDLRLLARQLTPTEIMEKGFADSVCQDLERLNSSGVCLLAYRRKGIEFRLEDLKEFILYSILNRYIYNAVYVEKTRRMAVHLTYRRQSICLQLNWDKASRLDGACPNPKAAENPVKRAALIGAHIRTSEDGSEKRVHIEIKR